MAITSKSKANNKMPHAATSVIRTRHSKAKGEMNCFDNISLPPAPAQAPAPNIDSSREESNVISSSSVAVSSSFLTAMAIVMLTF